MTRTLPLPNPAPTPQIIPHQTIPTTPINEVRLERRFTVDQPVTVTLMESPDCRMTARVRNVSRNGMRLEVEGTILNAGAAVKVSWGDRTLYGTIRHRSQRDGSTVLGIKLSSSWESFLEEILARHAEELESSRAALQSFSY